jgi:hypothetical protein
MISRTRKSIRARSVVARIVYASLRAAMGCPGLHGATLASARSKAKRTRPGAPSRGVSQSLARLPRRQSAECPPARGSRLSVAARIDCREIVDHDGLAGFAERRGISCAAQSRGRRRQWCPRPGYSETTQARHWADPWPTGVVPLGTHPAFWPDRRTHSDRRASQSMPHDRRRERARVSPGIVTDNG